MTWLEGWEAELPELEADIAEWPADIMQENPVWVWPEQDVEEWEHADAMARALGYRHYEEWYWSIDGFGGTAEEGGP